MVEEILFSINTTSIVKDAQGHKAELMAFDAAAQSWRPCVASCRALARLNCMKVFWVGGWKLLVARCRNACASASRRSLRVCRRSSCPIPRGHLIAKRWRKTIDDSRGKPR